MNFNINFPSGYAVNDTHNGNIDIHVILDEEVYFGTLFTINNISEIMQNEKPSKSYFWSTNMLVIKDLTKESIRIVINDLIKDDYLKSVFEKIGDIDSVYGVPPIFGELL